MIDQNLLMRRALRFACDQHKLDVKNLAHLNFETRNALEE